MPIDSDCVTFPFCEAETQCLELIFQTGGIPCQFKYKIIILNDLCSTLAQKLLLNKKHSGEVHFKAEIAGSTYSIMSLKTVCELCSNDC